MDYPTDGLLDGMLAIECYLQRGTFDRKRAASALDCLQHYARNARPHSGLMYLWPYSKHGQRIVLALGHDFRAVDYPTIRRELLRHMRPLRQIAHGSVSVTREEFGTTKLVLGELSSGMNSIVVGEYLEHWRRVHPDAIMLQA